MLKNIIVPVDFSEQAENALLFAAEIAKRISSPLTLFHANPDPENPESDKQKMEYLVNKLKSSFGPELFCQSVLAPFDLVHALKSQAGNGEDHLIVMGTKRAGGLKRILIGTNTVKVMAEVKTLILVIPHDSKFENFNRKGKNRVVLATDLEETENEAGYNFLSEFLRLMIEPKLRILNVRPKNTSLNAKQELQRSALLSGFGEEVDTKRITVFSSNVLDGITHYLDSHQDTGMIVMISRDSGGLFQRHFTREMASITHHPLLVLNEKS